MKESAKVLYFLLICFFFNAISTDLNPVLADDDKDKNRPAIVRHGLQSAEMAELELREEAAKIAKAAVHALDEAVASSPTPLSEEDTKIYISLRSPDLWVRSLVSGFAFTYVLLQEGHGSAESLILGVTCAGLSWGFQFFSPFYQKWLGRKGLLETMPGTKAGFFEGWFKEYLAQWLYLGVYHLVALWQGVHTEIISWTLVSTVFWSWLAEGTWSVVISARAEHLKDKYGATSKRAEYFYRSAFLVQAFLSSLLVVYALEKEQFATYAYYVTATLGLGFYGYLYVNWRELWARLRDWRSFSAKEAAQSFSQRWSWEMNALKNPQSGFRKKLKNVGIFCRNLLPVVRPLRYVN